MIPGSMGKDRERAWSSIYPLPDVFVRKIKMLKKPKFELGKLMELHGEKLQGRRQVLLKLNELVVLSPQFKNLLEIQMFNGDK